MNIVETYSMARRNIKGRKKTGRLLFAILFLALFIYFLVNSMVMSIDNLVYLIQEMPIARTLNIADEEGDLEAKLKDVCKDMDCVTEIYPYVDFINVEAAGIKDNKRTEMEIKAFSDSYKEYIVEGAAPKENELLLPHYMNAFAGENYEDGSKYIGKEITVYAKNYKGEEQVFKYRVSGTYDNLYAITLDTVLLHPKTAVSLYEYTIEGVEEYNEKQAAIYAEQGFMYFGPEKVYQYGVVVDSFKNVNKVKAELKESLGVSAGVQVHAEQSEYQSIFSFVLLIGMGITILLLITVLIMMIIMIGNDIRGRKKEMALYLVQGYTKENLQGLLTVEYVLRLVPVLIASTIATLIILALENIVIKNCLSMEFQILHMVFSLRAFVVGIGIMAVVIGTAAYSIYQQLKKIELLKEIKFEG